MMNTNCRNSIVTKIFIISLFLGFTTFSFRSVAQDIWPERVTDFTAQWDSSTGYVTVSLTAPTHSMTSLGSGNGDALPYLTKIILSRNVNYGDYIEVHTFDSPAPGETLSFVDMSVGEGLFQYKAVAYVDDCASYPEWCEIEIGQKPVDINDAYATCNKGNAPVTIFFTAPLLDTNGDVLRAIEKVEVNRYSNETFAYEVVGAVENPIPGEAYTYEDNDVVRGESYSYRLVVCTTAGSSYGTLVNVMVGEDSPVAPTNVVAQVVGNGVNLTWDAPYKGQTNGYIDVNELRYTVLRSATGSEYEADVLVENLQETTYFDSENPEKEAKYVYYIRAVNAQGESVGAASNEVVVGPPSALPFIETFDSRTSYEVPTTDYPGWTFASSETACAWYINDVLEIEEERTIATESGKGGMAFTGYGNYNDLEQEDYMTSGKIAFKDVKEPILKFRYYAFTGCNSTLAVEISANGGEFKQVALLEYDGMPQEGWESFVMSMSDYKYNTDYIQVRLHAHKGTSACPVIIDNFVISELPPVENLSYDIDNSLLTWKAPESPYLELTGYIVGINGTWGPELPADATQYDFSSFKDEYFLMMGIYAIYEGVYYSSPAEVDLTSVDKVQDASVQINATDGLLQVYAAEDAVVEVYSLDARQVLVARGCVQAQLSPGIYLVKVDTMVRKVVVK